MSLKNSFRETENYPTYNQIVYLFLRRETPLVLAHTQKLCFLFIWGSLFPPLQFYAMNLSAYCLLTTTSNIQGHILPCYIVLGVTFGHISLKLRKLDFRIWNMIRVESAETRDPRVCHKAVCPCAEYPSMSWTTYVSLSILASKRDVFKSMCPHSLFVLYFWKDEVWVYSLVFSLSVQFHEDKGMKF